MIAVERVLPYQYRSWLDKMSRSSQENQGYPGATCSDGRRMAAKERKEVEGQLIMRWKV
jgi:hypothetical protein